MAGITCLLGYAKTRHDGYAGAGLAIFTFFLPAASLVSIGLITWSIYLGSKPDENDSLQARSAFAVLALVIMPIAAVVCFGLGAKYATRFDVEILNRSSQPIMNIKVFGGGTHEVLPELHPGSSHIKSLLFESDGRLEISFDNPINTNSTHLIENYVTGLMGGYAKVEIQKDFSISISH